MTKKRNWKKIERPNRPVDFTVAKQLHCGDVLHKGDCHEDQQVYYGSYKTTKYIVIGISFNEEEQTFDLAVASEHTMLPLHLTGEEALGFHRLEDCPSPQRKAPSGGRKHKPTANQQITVHGNEKFRPASGRYAKDEQAIERANQRRNIARHR